MSPSDAQSTPDTRQWFVRMVAGGAVFGPIRTNGLVLWAAEGRVMPDDEISEDKVHWIPAQELPELCMDTLIAHPNGSFIGPFHRDALQALIREGKIPPDAQPFPKSELAQRLAARQMTLFGEDEPPPEPEKSRRKKSSPPEQPSTDTARLQEQLEQAKKACDALASERDALAAERDTLVSERDAAVAKRDAVIAERDTLASERDAAVKKLNAIQAQRDAMDSDAATDRAAAAKAAEERDALASERDAAVSDAATAREAAAKAAEERDALAAERDAAVSDAATSREAAAKAAEERDALAAERDAAVSDAATACEAFQAKLDAASAELASVLAARDAAESAVATARETAAKAVAERDSLAAERDTLVAERDALAAERDALQEKFDESRQEFTELLDFSNARDAEHAKAVTELEHIIADLRERLSLTDTSAQGEVALQARLHEREMDILCLARQLATASESAREREAALLKRIEDLEGGFGSLPLS